MSDEKDGPETVTAGRLIGYVRTEAGARDGDVQRWRLEKAGCDLIYTDADATGGDKSRPELARVTHQLREGDTLVDWKWERLTLDVLHALELNDAAEECGARLWSLCEPFDPRTGYGQMLMGASISLAAYESEISDEGLRVPPYAPVRLGQVYGPTAASLTSWFLTDTKLRPEPGRQD